MVYVPIMGTMLAVPIAAADYETARNRIKIAIGKGAQVIELRTDYLTDLNPEVIEKLVARVRSKSQGRKVKVIVTCRDTAEGGKIAYSPQKRIEALQAGIKAGADFIDCELENFKQLQTQEKLRVALARSGRARVILSSHNFEGGYPELGKVYRQTLAIYPAAIPKIVYQARHIADCFEAFELLHWTGGERIVLCMGEAGQISRILAAKLGSYLTFASLGDEEATAPGQVTIDEMLNLYHVDNMDADTHIYGIIGDPVGHSKSPLIHNWWFDKRKQNKVYLPLLVGDGPEGFGRFMYGVLSRRWLDFRGFSVTIPHKQNVLGFVREHGEKIDSLAARVGAANTMLISEHGESSVYNTDCEGATEAILRGLGITKRWLKNLNVSIVGAGGVSRAIVASLRASGSKVKIYNRTVEKAQQLAEEFNCDFAPLSELASLDTELLINCTSIGMHPNIEGTPVEKSLLDKEMAVFDTVYNPPMTRLLKEAKAKGCTIIDGVEMFIEQGRAQCKLFAGRRPSANELRKVLTQK